MTTIKKMIAALAALWALSIQVLAYDHMDTLTKELNELLNDKKWGELSEEEREKFSEFAKDFSTKNEERLKFFNVCEPFYLVIEDLNDDAKEIGLTKDRVQNLIESRLRSARIYKDGSAYLPITFTRPYLYVNINVVGRAFSVSLEFKKPVTDEYEHAGLAPTWDVSSTGTHGKDPRFIVSVLSELMDKFLVEYLRVNETACEKRWQSNDPDADGLSEPTTK